ncbi:hypothetical protein J2129_000207 [Methanofollis sp. W23]|uniref:hypothetical protein n=1 Tax=Methanofollis sp. W23 TaxID=2817849 RepID=UPI001D4134A9|nr:hypothetical protein [Methanofollis sp. W23]MBP2144753.1 hypothetical protein [Methanofollis sp. W23]
MDRKVGDLLGVLVWRSVPLGVDAVIFVSETHGIQVWYEHEGDCTGCPRHDECMLFLSDFVREMNITLPENRNPTEVADEIFRTVKE